VRPFGPLYYLNMLPSLTGLHHDEQDDLLAFPFTPINSMTVHSEHSIFLEFQERPSILNNQMMNQN
jgi:hypothetical protein